MNWDADELALGRSSPALFGHVVSGGTRGLEGAYVPFEHLLLLNDELLAAIQEQDAVFAGESEGGEHDRLIVVMPPRHGKSETTSKYTPAWYLGARPDRKVILASYEARFAESWGRKSRDLLEEHGPSFFGIRVSQGSSAAASWEIADHEGAMVTAGAGGPITGKGAHLFLIDDPVKNAEEAQSVVIQLKHWDWWRSTARTRLQRGAIVVLVMTRWHEADLVGRLLEHDAEMTEGEREGWKVLELPAIAEPDPETGGEYDALDRKPGEPLCPELGFDVRWARRTRAAVGTYWWSALYQGRPRPAEGLLFKRSHFRYFRHDVGQGLYVLEHNDGGLHPVRVDDCVHFQTADTAASEKEMADYSVVSTWAVTAARDLLLVNVERERFDDTRVGAFVSNAYAGAIRTPVRITVENASSGPKVIRELMTAGYPVASANPDKDKVTRALLAVARYEQHVVYHRRGAVWLSAFEQELLAFPNAAHDDQVDTASYAAIELPKITIGRTRRRERRPGEMAGVRTREM